MTAIWGSWNFFAGRIERLDSDFVTLITRARNSLASLRRGDGPLFEECRVSADDVDIPEDDLLPLNTD